MDDGHAGQHGNPIAGQHESDPHEENGDEKPQHGIPVIGPQHGRRGYGSRPDDHTGQDDARPDPLQHLYK